MGGGHHGAIIIMNVLLNELSYLHAPAISDDDLTLILNSLAEAIRFYRSLAPINQVTFWVSDLRIIESGIFLRNQPYHYTLRLVNTETRTVLLSMFSKLHFLDVEGTESFKHLTLNLSTSSIPKFMNLFFLNYGALSLFSDPSWHLSKLEFKNSAGEAINIDNWPKIEFFGDVTDYLNNVRNFFSSLITRLKINEHLFLPYRNVSDLIFRDSKFELYYRHLSANDKMAAFQLIGTAVAELNGYTSQANLNLLNSSKIKKRNIFHNSTTKKYVSIDFEKGVFEVLNEMGIHLGEYNFQGRQTGNADQHGRHDIRIK
jgi:hypothetical protein